MEGYLPIISYLTNKGSILNFDRDQIQAVYTGISDPNICDIPLCCHFWNLLLLFDFQTFGAKYLENFVLKVRLVFQSEITDWTFVESLQNYFKVKIFSDSRPKSAQKLILKVFADFQTKIICRLSKIFKIFIWCYTCARMVFLVSCEIKKNVQLSLYFINLSPVSLWANLWFLVVGTTVRLSMFWPSKNSE